MAKLMKCINTSIYCKSFNPIKPGLIWIRVGLGEVIFARGPLLWIGYGTNRKFGTAVGQHKNF